MYTGYNVEKLPNPVGVKLIDPNKQKVKISFIISKLNYIV